MNIASVPCRCGHSWPWSPRAMSGHLGEQRRDRQHLDVVPGGRGVHDADRLRGVRRAGHVGDHSPDPHRGQRAVQQRRLQLGQRRRRRPAVRRQRTSGRRRSAPRPVHGASSSTRSNEPGAHGGSRPSAASTSTSSSPASALRTSSARCGARSAAVSRTPSGRTAASSPALPPGPGAHVQPGRVRALERAPGRAAARPAGCPRPAPRPRRSAPTRSRPGSPPCSRTANGDHGPGSPPDSSTSSSRSIRRATRCTSGAASSASSAGLELVVAAQRVPPGVDDPARVVGGQREPLGAVATERGQPLLPVAAGGDLAQHGVDQAGGAGADDAAGQVDGRVDGGVRRHPQVDQLVGAQPQQVEDPRVELGQRPGDEPGEHRVERALRAQRAVGELGGEGGVALVELPLAQQLREQQVGVGGARGDAVQDVVGGQPGAVQDRTAGGRVPALARPRPAGGPPGWPGHAPTRSPAAGPGAAGPVGGRQHPLARRLDLARAGRRRGPCRRARRPAPPASSPGSEVRRRRPARPGRAAAGRRATSSRRRAPG